MLYHVIRRPLNPTTTNSSNQTRNNRRSGSVPTTPKLMPRYHYSRIGQNNNTPDSTLTRTNLDDNSSKSSMTATTTSNNNHSSYGPFKSSFIPLVTNQPIPITNKREFTQIPITREDGTPNSTNNHTRTVPITYIETATLPLTNNGNINSKQNFTNVVRPTSKYFQNNNHTEESTSSSVPRLPSVSRRLSLTIPVMTTVNTDDDTTKQTIPSSPTRQIPIRLPSSTTVASIPTNSSRISSAILRSSPISNVLQRQKTDIGEASSSSPTLITINNHQQTSLTSDFNVTSPIRRAEVTAREAIQGIARQQRNSVTSESSNRSPPISRRVIINLKNNQTVSLDSRLSSAMKPPPIPSSNRITQRNNLFHIPILHEIQMSSHPATIVAETSSSFQSSSTSNNGNYKNEFHMEIPVTITTSNDQENRIEQNNGKEEGVFNRERFPSATQTLKSILKRSSSRETVSRKNVSFMNA